ncbi:hypothetical protein OAG94_02065 [bacterium]|jgi:hypothetical protein|nr:hypothetical protein [bacterium]
MKNRNKKQPFNPHSHNLLFKSSTIMMKSVASTPNLKGQSGYALASSIVNWYVSSFLWLSPVLQLLQLVSLLVTEANYSLISRDNGRYYQSDHVL